MEPNPPEIELAKISRLEINSLCSGANQMAENFGQALITNTLPHAKTKFPTITQMKLSKMRSLMRAPVMVQMHMMEIPSLRE